MISFVMKEIYAQPSIYVIVLDPDAMTRFIFMTTEFFIFLSTIIGNLLFLGLRMLTPTQLNLVSIEPKRQLATTDSIESMSLLINQYQAYIVPCLSLSFMIESVRETMTDD
jgi:hypothetical protein